MKKLHILIIGLLVMTGLNSCADQFDTPGVNVIAVYGNPDINEEATTTIADLKAKYAKGISSNDQILINEETRIQGIVVGADESGNLYNQIVLRDETGAIIISISASGIYASCPEGQKIVVDLKGLYIGGYNSVAQIGNKYYNEKKGTYQVGRMPEREWLKHVRLLGLPSTTSKELIPILADEEWLKNANKDLCPYLVTLQDASITDADGKTQFAPDAEKDAGNGVTRSLKVGNAIVDLRTSAYCNFATEVLPSGQVNITGILTRYRETWQIAVRSFSDIQPISNK